MYWLSKTAEESDLWLLFQKYKLLKETTFVYAFKVGNIVGAFKLRSFKDIWNSHNDNIYTDAVHCIEVTLGVHTLGIFEQLYVPACIKSKWVETLELPTGLLAYRFAWHEKASNEPVIDYARWVYKRSTRSQRKILADNMKRCLPKKSHVFIQFRGPKIEILHAAAPKFPHKLTVNNVLPF
jgi:hypothetical protein